MKNPFWFIFTLTAKFVTTAFAFLSLSGCSSVFYYPSRVTFVNREKLPNLPSDVYFHSKNGKRLHGWYFKSKLNKPHALLVHFHGNAQNLSSHFGFLHEAPSQGFDHLIFDYQGYGQSEGVPTPQNLIEDGAAALIFAHAQNPNVPLIVFGQSLGGNVALRVISEMNLGQRQKVPIRAVFVDSTFGSYRSAARWAMKQNSITWILQPIAWLIVDNSGSIDGQVRTIAPIPLVVIHGTDDKVVPYQLGERLFKQARSPKELWTIPQGTHTDFLGRPEWSRKFYEELRRLSTH